MRESFDEQASFSIERVGGPKLLRKYRKAYLIDEFVKGNKVEGIIADHWKSLEHLKNNKKKYCLIHGKEINHNKGSSINKRITKVLDNVEKVIANSEYTKNLAIEIGINKEKIIVINPGIDLIKNLNQKSLDKVESLLSIKSPRLITVSRFDKRKNHEKTGLICDGNNLDEIYSSINLMLENKKYLEYGKNAKNSVSKFYWSNIVEQYKDILN